MGYGKGPNTLANPPSSTNAPTTPNSEMRIGYSAFANSRRGGTIISRDGEEYKPKATQTETFSMDSGRVICFENRPGLNGSLQHYSSSNPGSNQCIDFDVDMRQEWSDDKGRMVSYGIVTCYNLEIKEPIYEREVELPENKAQTSIQKTALSQSRNREIHFLEKRVKSNEEIETATTQIKELVDNIASDISELTE